MRKWMLGLVVAVLVALGGTAAAEVKVECVAAKGVEKSKPVEEGTSFAKSTWVYVWCKVEGATPGSKLKHVWKRDGNAEWTGKLDIPKAKWSSYSKRMVRAGSYVVEVTDEAGTVLTSVSLTAQ